MGRIQDAFQLYEQSFLSERGLWYRKRSGKRAKVEPVLVEEDTPGSEEVLQAGLLLHSEYGRDA